MLTINDFLLVFREVARERSSVVELHLAKVGVEGSNPFARFYHRLYLSLRLSIKGSPPEAGPPKPWAKEENPFARSSH